MALSSRIIDSSLFASLMDSEELLLTAICSDSEKGKKWALALYPERIGMTTRNFYLGTAKRSELGNEFNELIEAASIEQLIDMAKPVTIDQADLRIISDTNATEH